jgi:threonine/homoserine/homoserine lactone efflux protein
MPSADHLIAFATGVFLLAASPGPTLLYVATQTLARGRSAGLMAALGIHVGGYAHVLAATCGVAAIFRHFPELYLAVRIAGALYLVWLGIELIRARLDPQGLAPAHSPTAHRALIESIAVELLNPKVALFYIAFLPQFVEPTATMSLWLQLLALGAIANVAFTAADIATVLLTSTARSRAERHGRFQSCGRFVAGSVLIGLGATLALSGE